MPAPWKGKHVWIWLLDRCGELEGVIVKALSLGLSGLLVKGWDGPQYWPQVEAIAGPAHGAGLVVGAWGYSYGINPEGEAEAAKKCLAAGADWLVIDAEGEYERYPERTGAVLSAFKALGAPLGYTSFGLPRYHTGFPWEAFSKACDAALPQVYWGEFGISPGEALSLSLASYEAFGLPVAPVGQCYGSVSPDDIVAFGDLAEAVGLPGISYYDWQHASPEQLDAVGRAPYGRRVSKVSDWAKESWDKAVAKGIFDGTDPQGAVTREMLAVILDRCGLLDATDIPQKTVDDLKAAGLITDTHPAGAKVTWGELATVIMRLVKK